MLSKTAEYALRIVTCLARDENVSESADMLAEETQVPRRYLQRVLQDLSRASLVRSRSGPGGGYALARSPASITLLEVVNAVSPLERIKQCPLGLKAHKKLCPLHQELDRVYAQTEKAFANVTVEQVIRSGKQTNVLCTP